jgi:hypothetical protein
MYFLGTSQTSYICLFFHVPGIQSQSNDSNHYRFKPSSFITFIAQCLEAINRCCLQADPHQYRLILGYCIALQFSIHLFPNVLQVLEWFVRLNTVIPIMSTAPAMSEHLLDSSVGILIPSISSGFLKSCLERGSGSNV